MVPDTHTHYDECDEVDCTTSTPKPKNGRRALAEELKARHKLLVRDTHDTSRLVKMAPRAIRRARQGDDFRPVYHHGVPTKLTHSQIISAMRVHKDGRRAAQIWQPKVNTARACASFGLAVKLFLANVEISRRAAVKAACITS